MDGNGYSTMSDTKSLPNLDEKTEAKAPNPADDEIAAVRSDEKTDPLYLNSIALTMDPPATQSKIEICFKTDVKISDDAFWSEYINAVTATNNLKTATGASYYDNKNITANIKENNKDKVIIKRLKAAICYDYDRMNESVISLLNKELAILHAHKGAALMGLLRAALSPYCINFRRETKEAFTFNIFSIAENGQIFRYRAWKEVALSHHMRPYLFNAPKSFQPFLLSKSIDMINNNSIIILPIMSQDRIKAILTLSSDREKDREELLRAIQLIPVGVKTSAGNYSPLGALFREYSAPLKAAGIIFRKDREDWYRQITRKIEKVEDSNRWNYDKDTLVRNVPKAHEQILTELVDAGDHIESYAVESCKWMEKYKLMDWNEEADAMLDRLIKRLASKVILRQPPLPPIDYDECRFLTPYISQLEDDIFVNPALRGIPKLSEGGLLNGHPRAYNRWHPKHMYEYLAEEERLAHQTDRANITIEAPFVFSVTRAFMSELRLYTRAVAKIEYFTNGLSKILDLDKSYITGSAIAAAFDHNEYSDDYSDRLKVLSSTYSDYCLELVRYVRDLADIIAQYAVCDSDRCEKMSDGKSGFSKEGKYCPCRDPAIEIPVLKCVYGEFIEEVYPPYYITSPPIETWTRVFGGDNSPGSIVAATTYTGPLSAKITVIPSESDEAGAVRPFSTRTTKVPSEEATANKAAPVSKDSAKIPIKVFKLELKRGADIDIVVGTSDMKEFDQIALDHYNKVKTLWPDAKMTREDKPLGGHMWNIDNPTASATFRAIQIYRGNVLTSLSHHIPPVRGCYGGPADKAGERPFTVAASLILCHLNRGVYSEPHFFASRKVFSQDVLAKNHARGYTLGVVRSGNLKEKAVAHPVRLLMKRFCEKSKRAKQWYATIPNIIKKIEEHIPDKELTTAPYRSKYIDTDKSDEEGKAGRNRLDEDNSDSDSRSDDGDGKSDSDGDGKSDSDGDGKSDDGDGKSNTGDGKSDDGDGKLDSGGDGKSDDGDGKSDDGDGKSDDGDGKSDDGDGKSDDGDGKSDDGDGKLDSDGDGKSDNGNGKSEDGDDGKSDDDKPMTGSDD